MAAGDGPAGPTAPALTVARVLSVLPEASTSPALVETQDGRRWVLKFSGAGPGPFGLLTEFLALATAAAFGAPVPEARALWLPAGFPWMAGTDEFDAMLQRSPGWNLGIGWFEDARPVTPADMDATPDLAEDLGADLGAIALSDCFLQNVDRTPRNPNLLVAGGRLRAIDYDACLYLSRAIGPPRPPSTTLPPGHMLADRPLRLPAGAMAPVDYRRLVGAAPEAWVESSGLQRPALADRLTASLSAWTAAMTA